MAAIMAFFDRHAHGRGGTLSLYLFEEETYDALEEKLSDCGSDEETQKVYEEIKRDCQHCLAATIQIDSQWVIGTEAN